MRLYDFIERLSARLVVRWGAPIPDVIQLRPRAISLAKAKALFATGHFEACVEGLALDESHHGVILRARASLRLNDVSQARTTLEAYSPAITDKQQCADRGVWLCRVMARSGELDHSFTMQVENIADELNDQAVSSGIQYARVLQAWFLSDYTTAEQLLMQSERQAIGRQRVEMLSALSSVAIVRGDTDAQIQYAKNALDYYDRSCERDDYLEIATMNNLSLGIANRYSLVDRQYWAKRLEKIRPGVEPRRIRCDMLINSAWIAAIDGDYTLALSKFREAGKLATTPGLRAISSAWRAYIAYEMNEPLLTQECINDAQAAFDKVDWESTSSDEPEALLVIAEVLANMDSKRAAGLLDVHSAIRSRSDRLSPNAHEIPIDRARIAQIYGKIERLEGRYTSARIRFLEAFQLFKLSGTEWRAAISALDAYEIAVDPDLLKFAIDEAACRPNSLLTRRLAHINV